MENVNQSITKSSNVLLNPSQSHSYFLKYHISLEELFKC